GDEFFKRARLRRPSPEALVEVTLHLDPEVLRWFQLQEAEYEREINAALRIYAEAHSQYRSPRRKTA
ncbi:MAG: BrnA antitoxin family protein, partial [Aeromicrobium sp.]